MEALLSRLSLLLDDLNDFRIRIPPERLREIVAECTAALGGQAGGSTRGVLHSILALSYYRLGDPIGQLTHTRELARLHPHDVLAMRNYGANLVEVGDVEMGLTLMKEAAGLPSPHRSRTLGDLSAAYAKIGRWDEATEAFLGAVRTADYTSERDLMSLAFKGAHLGFGRQSLEFLARYLSIAHGVELGGRESAEISREVVNEHPEWLWFAMGVSPLRLAILQTLSVDAVLAGDIPWNELFAEIVPPAASAGAEDMLSLMKPLIDEATLSVVGKGG
ncbi:hypothetical protein COCOR_04664 [Corallococcus coralloides DSM 2259]|uniref:Uncharacterized protein n=1 Tax=Corallococcus coralloides (strain ATCC 25202 / DSM 2259 / NBRC 100086 / M2) TaxID=1144275 RepID=H8MJD4_CORCM|nr:hypothetical protein [Corallococcus coralloides]AFE05952.1 hypothetical protein COCOR_04664 [Corallococcus coralloides DSM 2259]